MPKLKLKIEKPRGTPESDSVMITLGDKISARGVVDEGNLLIDYWASHEPMMGHSRKALEALNKRFGEIAVADAGSDDPKDSTHTTFTFWMCMFEEGLVDAVRYHDSESDKMMWATVEENPRGGKRIIPRKKKKRFWGSDDDLFDNFERDLIQENAKKISRHSFLQHLYKHSKRRELPVVEEQAGYDSDNPINQDSMVEYFLGRTRNNIEIAYFTTPKTDDIMWVFGVLGSA